MSIQKKHEELIESSFQELENLRIELADLVNLKLNIEKLLNSNENLPPLFLDLFQKLKAITDLYIAKINEITKKYIDQGHDFFTKQVSLLNEEILNFTTQVNRIIDFNLEGIFNVLSNQLVQLFQENLSIELNKLDAQSRELQNQIDKLSIQVGRIEAVDLDKNFDKLQTTLSEIFGAINNINISLTSVVQSILGIVQALSKIDLSIESNSTRIITEINKSSKRIDENISVQNSLLGQNFESILDKLTEVLSVNSQLISEVKILKILVGISIAVSVVSVFF